MLYVHTFRRTIAANAACRKLLNMGANVRPAPARDGADHTPDLGPLAVVWLDGRRQAAPFVGAR